MTSGHVLVKLINATLFLLIYSLHFYSSATVQPIPFLILFSGTLNNRQVHHENVFGGVINIMMKKEEYCSLYQYIFSPFLSILFGILCGIPVALIIFTMSAYCLVDGLL